MIGEEEEETGPEEDNLKLLVAEPILLPLSLLVRREGLLLWLRLLGESFDLERGEEGETGEKGEEVLRLSRLRCRGVVLGVEGEPSILVHCKLYTKFRGQRERKCQSDRTRVSKDAT